MANTYKFTGSDGVDRTFVGERPPTDEEMAQIVSSKASSPAPDRFDAARSAATGIATAAGNMPAIASQLATVPNIQQTGSMIGRVIGGVSPIVGGAVAGAKAYGPAGAIGGALMGVAGAAKGAWAGGRTGWFTGSLVQKLAAPAASALEAVAPFLEPLGYAPALQGLVKVPGFENLSTHDLITMPDDKLNALAKEAGLPPSQPNVIRSTLRMFLK